MLKTRRKSISLLVALAFVLTLVLPVGAALAQDRSATLSPLSLTESELDGAVLTVTLSGDTFKDSMAEKGNFTIASDTGVPGLSIWDVQITGSRTAKITLAFDGTDFDSNATLQIDIAGTELTSNISITTDPPITLVAEKETLAAMKLTVTDDGNVKEGKESEGKLIITLEEGGTFDDNITRDVITVDVPSESALKSVKVENVELDTTKTKLTVSFSVGATAPYDYDENIEAEVKVAKDVVFDSQGNNPEDDLTAPYTFTAFKEEIKVTGSTEEGKEDGAVLTVNLIADTEVCYFVNDEDELLANVTMYGQPAGVSLGWVKYVDKDTIELHLAGNATYDYDTNKTATVRVKPDALKWNTDILSDTFDFVATVEEPAPPSAVEDYPRGFSSGYQYVLSGEENQKGGFAAIRLPEDPDVPRSADKLVVSVSLPDGVQYMAKASSTTINDYVTVHEGNGNTTLTPTLVSSSRSGLEIAVTKGSVQPLDLAVVFEFDEEGTSALEIDSDVTGNIKVTVEFIGFRGEQNVFSDSEDLLIAKVSEKDVTVSAATPKTVAVGSGREAAKITIAEGTAGVLRGAEVKLEIVTDGVSFDKATISGIRYATPTYTISGDDHEILTFTMPSTQTVNLPGRVEITPYLDVTPDVDGDIEIQVTVKDEDEDELADETVTVAKATAAVTYTVTDVKNTGGSIVAGHPATFLKEEGKAAEFTIKTVGSATFPSDALIYVELSGAKFYSTNPFKVKGASKQPKTYADDKAAWFAPDPKEDEVTLSDFQVKADGEAAAGDITVKLSSNLGTFDPAEVVIGQVVKPFEVTASAAPAIAYLGRAQAAGDIVIKETKKGALDQAIQLELPEGVSFASKPTVKVTDGNLDLGSTSLEDRGRILVIGVDGASTRPSTVTISGIKYDVSRLALDGDVEVKIVGAEGMRSGWEDKTIATVVNAKVVSAAKREASFVIGSTTYTVNGEEYTMDVAPYIDAATGRTYVPVRYVAYALGVAEENIFWDAQARTVTLLKGDRVVQMTIGSKAMFINGASLAMDAAPVIKDGRTMLPFRWAAQALGASVSWDEATKTVTMKIE